MDTDLTGLLVRLKTFDPTSGTFGVGRSWAEYGRLLGFDSDTLHHIRAGRRQVPLSLVQAMARLLWPHPAHHYLLVGALAREGRADEAPFADAA